jgi:hypothetical protein
VAAVAAAAVVVNSASAAVAVIATKRFRVSGGVRMNPAGSHFCLLRPIA